MRGASTRSHSATGAPSPASSPPLRRAPRSHLPPPTNSAQASAQARRKMCISKTTKSSGFRAAQGFIAAAHGPPHLRSDSAFSVHGMGTRSLATKRRAFEAIKVSVVLSWAVFSTGDDWDCSFFFFPRPRPLKLLLLLPKNPSTTTKKKKKTPQAVALNAEAPAPIEPAAEFSSPARKVAIFVGERERESRVVAFEEIS